jgi:hypothetical protein
MHPASIRFFTSLISALLIGVVACHLVCRDPIIPSADSKEFAAETSRPAGNNLRDRAESASSSTGDTFLQPIPDPGPGTKGFDPWANSGPIEGTINCDGSICETSVAQRQIIPSGGKQPKSGLRDGPTLAFPTVFPTPPRGQLIEVDVKFTSVGN